MTERFEACASDEPPARGLLNKPVPQKMWLEDLFDGVFALVDGGGDGLEPNGLSGALGQDAEELAVHVFEPVLVDPKP